ncbi:MAG: hypothetical protein AB1696_29205 [Planctomycetota bacterium]
MKMLWLFFVVPLVLMAYASVLWIVRMVRTAIWGKKGEADKMAAEVFFGLACATINFALGLAYFKGIWPTILGRPLVSHRAALAQSMLLLFVVAGFGFWVGIVRLVRYSLFGRPQRKDGAPKDS